MSSYMINPASGGAIVGDSVRVDSSGWPAVGDGESDESAAKIRADLQVERQRYLAYKLLTETAWEITRAGEHLQDDFLRIKVKRILTWRSPMLTENSLDLSHLDTLELKCDEGVILKQAVEAGLHRKLERLSEEFECMTGENIDRAFCSERFLLNTVFYLKHQLNAEQYDYATKLRALAEVLAKALCQRLEGTTETISSMMRRYEAEAKVYELQSTMCETNARVQTMSENEVSIEAYTDLISDLAEQESECQAEVEELKRVREQFRAVQSEEFNHLLQDYLQYKLSYEKKKCMYQQFRGKEINK